MAKVVKKMILCNDDSPDLSNDIANSSLMMSKLLDDVYAQNMYAALCNNQFQKIDVFHILRDDTWACTWRSAGRLVAGWQRSKKPDGTYMDFYCSGMTQPDSAGYQSEGFITKEILVDLKDLGWWSLMDFIDE